MKTRSRMLNLIILFLYLFTLAASLDEGEICNVSGRGEAGKCININQCEYAKALLQNGEHPGVCGFTRKDPLVCCPTSQEQSAVAGTKSRKMCETYHKKSFNTPVLALGTPAKPNEFPHMAALGYEYNNKTSYLCGGSLISHFYILTAAHCVINQEYGSPKWVRLADLDLEDKNGSTPLTVSIARIYVHRNYKKKQNDIALIRSSKYIYFRPAVLPACLQTEPNIPVNILGATGWGRQGLFGEQSTHLLKINLGLVDHRTCLQRHPEVLDQFQICAGDSVGQDTCPGDSGGPLHYYVNASGRVKRHFVVAGVTSYGRGCGGEHSLGVYTRVSAYLDWIENIVWAAEDDEKPPKVEFR